MKYRHIILSVLITLAALAATIHTVTATQNFTPRTTAPHTNNRHFTTDNPFYQVGFGMPNCTAYAWGRAYEILGHRPNLNLGNAMYWFYNNGGHPSPYDNFTRGQEPRLGAIAVWGAGSFGNFGHVAVVEGINEDGTVDLSESFWSGANFAFSTNVDVHHVRGWGPPPENQNFLGFIYLCGFIYTPLPTQNQETTPVPDEPKEYEDVYEPGPAEEPEQEPDLVIIIPPPPPARTLRFVIGSTTFYDNGVPHTSEAAPFIKERRTMVPLRFIGEALGAANFTHNAGVITFTLGNRDLSMTINEPLHDNMGTPVIVEGRTFVPLWFVIGEMGAATRWDGDVRAVYVYV